jgi:DNA modification methylase
VNARGYKGAHFATVPPKLVEPCVLAGCPAGGVVLDPFAGSGTVGEVCIMHGRDAVLIELNEAYIPLIEERLAKARKAADGRLFA